MPTVDVNIWAILAATLVSMVIGALWYMPSVFGRDWMESLGKSAKELSENNTPLPYVVSALSAFFTAYVLAYIVGFSAITELWQVMVIALTIWVGFSALPTAMHAAFDGSPRRATAISSAHYLATLVASALIIGAWK